MIVAKLRQVDVLVSQGQNIADAIRQIGVSEVAFTMSCTTPAAQLTFHPDHSVGANHFLGLDCSNQAKLGFEKLSDEHVQSTIRQHVLDRHALGLAQPVSAALGLKMIGWNPIEVLKYHMGCGRERDANASGDDVANRYPHLRVALE